MSDDDNHERINRNGMLMMRLIVFHLFCLGHDVDMDRERGDKYSCVKELNHGPRIEFPNVTLLLS